MLFNHYVDLHVQVVNDFVEVLEAFVNLGGESGCTRVGEGVAFLLLHSSINLSLLL